jgi:uncharacterized repeat protein (TIGR03803 family)
MKFIKLTFLFVFLAATHLPAQNFTVLHTFTNCPDGAHPFGGIIVDNGVLYGTTDDGGTWPGSGIAYRLSTNGADYSILYSFPCWTRGVEGGTNFFGQPGTGLVSSGSTLYGTTSDDVHGFGTVFEINTNGMDFTALDILGAASPSGSMVMHGTNLFGILGAQLFEVNTDGTQFNVLTNLPWFSIPESSLLLSNNILYGTTIVGVGDCRYGNVFKVNIDGTGLTIIKGFTNLDEGSSLQDQQLVLSGATLYGVATWGGLYNYGTVFKVNTDGTGFAVLRHFKNSPDAANPMAGLTLSGSTLYGVSWHGGAFGDGTVFRINTDGTGFDLLKSFSATNSDGATPSGIVVDGGILYGTTSGGGSAGAGVVFSLATPVPELRAAQTGGNLVVQWVDDGLSHWLETTTNPGGGNWTAATGLNWTNCATGTTYFGLTITNAASQGSAFFRLR